MLIPVLLHYKTATSLLNFSKDFMHAYRKDTNCWGRGLYGQAVIEAIQLEKSLKGVRVALSEEAAKAIDRELVLVSQSGSEFPWVFPENEKPYLDKLRKEVFFSFDKNPATVCQYVDTMRMIVRATDNMETVKYALDVFRGEPLLPSEVSTLWTDCFRRALDDPKARKFMELALVVRELLKTNIGGDWVNQLREEDREVRSTILAIAQDPAR